ncbi:fructose-bisphosphatase class I [Candidatus Peregrinibacteria bacterium HGW-Peregrinibacteria-1]|jgi:fructose-1,6-bisphosphatase I|nr:MAG: fructose-bisphosphatase class I [Candidatus Peregrinibacteria bacterium HGW-Peregrinibacteria-1]
MLLSEYLREKGVADDLAGVFLDLAEAGKEIRDILKTDLGEEAGTANVYGDDQMKVDVEANEVFVRKMRENGSVGVVASEELDGEHILGEGKFGVAADPIDGSSLLDVNLAVGSIFGVYETGTFVGCSGRDQLGAMCLVYGPRVTLVLTFGAGVSQFILMGNGDFVLVRDDFVMKQVKMFAPGNAKASVLRDDYFDLLSYWFREGYKLRYSGGMVPDIYQILIKGGGIFAYPADDDAPNGKLRLLVEAAPMAFLIEQAGGAASDGEYDILDRKISNIEQRTIVYIGSREEVDRCKQYLG